MKYFQFKNTINGTAFVVRYFISMFFATFFGYWMGYFASFDNWGAGVFFAFLMTIGIFLNLATYHKRIKAIFPQYIMLIMSTLVTFNIISLIGPPPVFGGIMGLFIFIFNLVLTFKNSDILYHKG
jgi:hypothetical protein